MRDILVYYSNNNDIFDFTHSIENHPAPYPLHMHTGYELFYLISGNITYRIEGQSINIKNGDILVINNRELHQPIFNSTEPYERITIHFKPEYVSYFQTADYSLLKYFDRRKLGVYNRIEKKLVELLNISGTVMKIGKIIQGNAPERDILIKTTFVELLILLNNAYNELKVSVPTEEIFDERISNIIDYISRNLANKITLQRLSEEFHLSIFYLSHIFKIATGFSVSEYIQFKRITLAKELLLSGVSPTSTALMIGFSDYPGFYRAFRKITGSNPKNYIRLA